MPKRTRPTCLRDGCPRQVPLTYLERRTNEALPFLFCSHLCQQLHLELLATEQYLKDNSAPENLTIEHAAIWTTLVEASDLVTQSRRNRARINNNIRRRGRTPVLHRFTREELLRADVEARGLDPATGWPSAGGRQRQEAPALPG